MYITDDQLEQAMGSLRFWLHQSGYSHAEELRLRTRKIKTRSGERLSWAVVRPDAKNRGIQSYVALRGLEDLGRNGQAYKQITALRDFLKAMKMEGF